MHAQWQIKLLDGCEVQIMHNPEHPVMVCGIKSWIELAQRILHPQGS